MLLLSAEVCGAADVIYKLEYLLHCFTLRINKPDSSEGRSPHQYSACRRDGTMEMKRVNEWKI